VNSVKFYKDDKKGGLIVVTVKIEQPSFDAMQGKRGNRIITLARAETVMAKLGYRRKHSLTPELRSRIPRGGMASVGTIKRNAKLKMIGD
jgi:hypothetical protein